MRSFVKRIANHITENHRLWRFSSNAAIYGECRKSEIVISGVGQCDFSPVLKIEGNIIPLTESEKKCLEKTLELCNEFTLDEKLNNVLDRIFGDGRAE